MDKPSLSSVEQMRDELRRLGYLDHGVDRFVLAGAAAKSPLRASVSAAGRVGLLGGLLFGAASTLAAAGLEPRLRSEPRDLLVLALYLAAAFFLLTAAGALLGGLLTAALARRVTAAPGPRLSRNVGLALGIAGLAYFALWWRSHAGGGPLGVQLASLVLGLGLCLCLGRFGSLAAVAVLSAGGLGARLPPASLSRRHMLPVLATVALAFGGAVAGAAYFSARRAAEVPDFAVVPTGLRVRVVGIDGLDGRLADQMIARGEMPRLAGLLAAGARGRLRAEPEQVPAIVWTTIATGRGPEAHGIQATGARRLAGMRTPVPLGEEGRFARALGAASDLLRITRTQPASSVLRTVKAFWNVAAEKGLRVGIVNWWATWPADPVNGYIVTERALFKLEKGGAFDRETYPPEVFERLRPLATEAAGSRPHGIDRFHARVSAMLRRERSPDLEVVYFPGLDIETMRRLEEVVPSGPAALDARMEAVRDYYRFTDGLLDELLGAPSPAEVVILVGDPGRLSRRTGAAEGLIVIVGQGVAPGDLGLVSERDVAPTVLHLSGLPMSRELDGVVLTGALDPKFLAEHPVRQVAAYGRRPAARPAESAFDGQMLEELRSLGYIR